MGYYSDAAYAIVFDSHEDRNKVIDMLAPEQWEIIRDDGAVIEEDRILFHDDSTKWYPDFPEVKAHTALLEAAQDAEMAHQASKGEEGVYSMGIFIRLGEEDADTEREMWGADDAPTGFPDPWDLVHYRREIMTAWD